LVFKGNGDFFFGSFFSGFSSDFFSSIFRVISFRGFRGGFFGVDGGFSDGSEDFGH